MHYDTVDEIRSWPVNDSGWSVDPLTHKSIKLGCNVTIGNQVFLGDSVNLGNGVRVGNNVKIGSYSIIGIGTTLGDGVTLGYVVEINSWVEIGNGVTIVDKIHLPSVNIRGFVAHPYAPGVIRVGCEIHTIEDWRVKLTSIMHERNIDSKYEDSIRAQIEWLAGWFTAWPDAMK